MQLLAYLRWFSPTPNEPMSIDVLPSVSPCLDARAPNRPCAPRLSPLLAAALIALAACGGDGPTTETSVGDDTDVLIDVGAADVGEDAERSDTRDVEPDADVESDADAELGDADADAQDASGDVDADAEVGDIDADGEAGDADALDASDSGDAEPDVDRDVTPDADPDVASDVIPDVAPDAPVDAEPDTPVDAEPDAPVDVEPDAPVDVAPDAPVDVAPDAPVDVEPDPDTPPTECGDGLREGDEACDDGNTVEETACEYGTSVCEWCSADCSSILELTGPHCGDGVVDEEFEECDTAPAFDCPSLGLDAGETECVSCAMISDDCHESVCGDGTREGSERCDDGNTVTEDACEYGTSVCEWCNASCGRVLSLEGPYCGDTVIQPEFEDCDGSPTFDCDSLGLIGDTVCAACTMDITDCHELVCGDGIVEGAEECDDGNVDDDDGCSSECLSEGDHYDGWVAYVSAVGTALERVSIVAGDRSEGPYTLPADGRFSIARHPSFSPDGTEVYYALLRPLGPAIRAYQLSDATFVDLVDTGFTALRFPQISPDGTTLLFSGKTADTALVWNIYTMPIDGSAAPTALTSVTDGDATSVFVSAGAWSCDGTEIHYLSGRPGDASGDPGTSDLWTMGADGSSPVQLTTGLRASSVVPAVRSDCTEVMVDRLTDSAPSRVDLATGERTSFGLPSSDSNCSYYGTNSFVVCERESGPPPDFTPCTVGSAECVRDIVVLGLDTGEMLRNLTQSIDTRETLPVASFQRYTALPLLPPPEE